jgi:hypothetical protein
VPHGRTISMIPDASCWGSSSRTTAVSGAGVNGGLISIGMNSFDDTTDRRASAFFHAKIRFAFMPCRRAISATDASPRLASSTILSFSASGQVRLRRWRRDGDGGTGSSSDNVPR